MNGPRGGNAAASPASMAGRAELDLLVPRLVHLFRRQEDDGFGCDCAALIDGERECGRADIVGEFDDRIAIYIAEREIHRFELAADLREVLQDRLAPADAAFLLDPLGAFGGVARLEQIFRHGVLQFLYFRVRLPPATATGKRLGVIAWRRRIVAGTAEERSRRLRRDMPRRSPPRSAPDRLRARSHRADR